MAEADVDRELRRIVRLRAVTDADQLQVLGETSGHANNHVVDQGTVQTMHRAELLQIVGASHVHDAVLDLKTHLIIYTLRQRTLGSLDGHDMIVGNRNSDSGRYLDRELTNSRH